MKRGRPGKAHLTIIKSDGTNSRPPLTPFDPLSPQEQKIFSMLATENVHLRQTDAILLAALAKCFIGLRNTDNAGDFQKLAASLVSLARQFRLSPQSRCDPKTLSRRIADQYDGPRPWDRHED